MSTITTQIPARMDRLPWSRWHWLVVAGLGTVWILDGLEVKQRVEARFRGPGRYRSALAHAQREGRIRRVGRRRWEAVPR